MACRAGPEERVVVRAQGPQEEELPLEEALFVLVKAYDALGINDLRDDAERVMRKNFPDSDYYKRGLDRKEPWWKLW